MSARSLNKVTLIGNLTRDPELRYTPAGTAVCTFGLATNRSWTTQSGETKEETEFHRVVAWNKLGELCAQLLAKGRKVYVEGRLSTHAWTAQDGSQKSTTEVVIEDMILLDSKRIVREEVGSEHPAAEVQVTQNQDQSSKDTAAAGTSVVTVGSTTSSDDTGKTKKGSKKVQSTKTEKTESAKEKPAVKPESQDEQITPDDIPF